RRATIHARSRLQNISRFVRANRRYLLTRPAGLIRRSRLSLFLLFQPAISTCDFNLRQMAIANTAIINAFNPVIPDIAAALLIREGLRQNYRSRLYVALKSASRG
ncbi:MAG: hypothetical protein SNJ81_12950, partial [Cyanobacteriota bacterium]